jgi:hypothetical protein
VGEPLPCDLEEPTVARDPHDRLRDAEGDDFRVCDHATGVPRPHGQEIVSSAINDGAESVEVGVHRGLLVDGVFSTADFGLSAQNPWNTAAAVESLI